MVTLRSILIVALISAITMMGMACSSDEPSNQLSEAQQEAVTEQAAQPEVATPQVSQPNDEPVQMAQEPSPAEMPKTIEISGMVEQVDDGIVIVTDLGKYNVVGQDLSAMVGKTVNVTGAVEESGGQYTINVLSVSESE